MEKLKNNTITSYRVVKPRLVQGAKAGSKPSQPNIADDTVASLSLAKILYGLGEGEISGIVGGAKGIFLEDTPLQDDNGNSNFDNVTWDFRSGTLEQDYIKGFPDVSNEIPVSVELKSSTAWVKAINKTDLSAVRIRLAWTGLKKQELKSGDVNGYKIDYAIDVKTGSGAYVEVLKTKIQDKVSGKYERTHRIDLPESTNGWQIRVRRLTPNANSELIQDKMFIESITEVIDVKLRYPNTALLGLQYDAKTFSRIAKIAVRARGKIISIPSNYDTNTGLYTGLWNGTFKQAYSNNPSWIFYDLITNSRYGLGKRIDPSMINKWALYNLGVYCDELIDNGEGGKEKRYSCNVYLQSQQDAFKVLQQLAGIFKGITYWNGEQIVLDADVPQDPVYTFSRANVIDGEFNYTGTRLRDRHTVAKVAFDNPNEGYKTEYEYIRDEKAIAKFGINIVDISAIGCTSRAQAQRAGLWALKSEQLETRTVSFKTGLEGFIPQVGNIIEVSDELLAGRANGGRISKVQGKAITLDRDLTVKVNDFIVANGTNGISEKRKVINVAGKVITIVAAFENVVEGSVFAIRSTDLTTMLFRVMTIKPDDNSQFSISAIQHEPLKYNAVDFGADVKPTNISTLKPTTVAAPSSVNVSATYKVVQGQTVATMVIQWSQVKEAVSYRVEWRKDNGNWIKAPVTGNVSLEVTGVYAGNYLARVVAVDAFDVSSLATTSTLSTVKGKVGKPNSLAGIKATGVLFGMVVEWFYKAGSEDTAYTEIEVATDATGANTALLGHYSYPTNKTEVTGLQGNLTAFYRGRIVDKLGNVGDWSKWVSGTTDASADKVLDILNGQISESQLHKDLTTKIDKIDDNTGKIAIIDAEVDKAKADLIEANKLLEANKLEASKAVAAAKADIAKAKADIVKANDTITAAKADIAKANADLLATNNSLTSAKGELATAKTDITKAKADIVKAKGIADAAKADSAANKTELVAINKTVGANKTSVDLSITELVNKDIAFNNLYTALKSEYDTNKASVSNSLTTLTNKDTSLSSLLTALDTDYKGNKTAIRKELTAVSTKTNSTATSLSSLTTEVGKNKTAISTEATTRSTEDKALSDRIVTVLAKTNSALGKIATAETTIASNTGALAQQKLDIVAGFKESTDAIAVNTASITAESLARSNAIESVTKTVSTLDSAFKGNKASVSNSLSTLTNKDTALTNQLTALTARVGTAEGSISTNNAALVAKDKTIVDSVTALNSAFNGNKSSVEQSLSALTTKDTALTKSLTALTARVGTAEGSITTNNNALVAKDKVIVDSVTALNSDYQGNKTAIRNELTAVSNKTNSTANSLSALTTKVGTNTTAISTETTARSNADTALGNRITTVEGKTNTALGRITTVENVAATNKSSIASTKNDITAKFKEAKEYSDLKRSILVIDDKTKKFINPVTYSSNASSTVGYLVIETPITPNRMVNIKIGGYNYTANNNNLSLSVGFYNYSSSFNNYSYESTGNTAIGKVQLAKKDADNKAVLIIGLPNTVWSYPKIVVEEALVGYQDSLDSYLDGFSVKITKNISSYTELVEVTGVEVLESLTENSAAISTEAKSRADRDTAITKLVTTLDTDYKGNKTAIRNELTAVSNKANSTANSLSTLTTTVGGNTTKISQESTARSSADTALGNRITATDAIAKNAQSRVGTAETALSTANRAIATLRTDLVASYTVQDTRNTDELPQYYYTNYPKQKVQEFKRNSTLAGVIGAGDYVALETNVKWSDASGGSIIQTAITDDNRVYIRTSAKATAWGTWLEQEDVKGSAAKVAALKAALDGKIKTTDARITAEKKVAADANSATAKQVGTIQTTVNGHTTSIKTHQSSINGLNAQYTVKLDSGGRVSGFGIASSPTQTDFAINADKFYIAPPTGSSKGSSPFMVLTKPTVINKVTVAAGTYMRSAYIHNGSIDIAKINKASIKDLSAISANIGHFKSAPTGARLEIKDSLLSVYDSNNKLRVRLGLW